MPQLRGVEAPVSDNYAAICAVLWSQRELLESLACTAVIAQLLPRRAAALAVRPRSDAHRAMIERLRLQEVLRAAMVEALKDDVARPAPSTLAAIAADAPEPWATMLTEHREVLRSLLADVTSVDGVEQLSLAEFLA
jgi:hypothetical protein